MEQIYHAMSGLEYVGKPYLTRTSVEFTHMFGTGSTRAWRLSFIKKEHPSLLSEGMFCFTVEVLLPRHYMEEVAVFRASRRIRR